jgi:hypothetical protein
MSMLASSSNPWTWIFCITLLWASITPGHAASCKAQIEQVQSQIDAKADAVAGAGPAASESAAARLHRQPTPSSIAQAEGRLGEGTAIERALAALERAREADRIGNKNSCQQALVTARSAISPY